MGPNGDNHGQGQEKDEMSRQLAEVERLVQRIARRLDREAEALDDIVDALSRLRTPLTARLSAAPSGNGNGGLAPLRLYDAPSAEPRAQKLQFEWRADGSASARIDFGLWFKLPPALAELMHLLSDDAGESDDGVVGWKTEEEIAAGLTRQAKAGRPVSKRAVIQRIHRLRKTLVKQGVGDALIQTNRRKGWRFALVRKTQPAANRLLGSAQK